MKWVEWEREIFIYHKETWYDDYVYNEALRI